VKTKYFFFVLLFINTISILFAQRQSSSWKTLFDGKSLNGWTKVAGSADYKIENGVIEGITKSNSPNTFLIYNKRFPGDFVLEMEAMIEDTTMNSGIQFKSNYDPAARNGSGKVYGYQYELDPSTRRWTGGLYDEGRRDWLYPGSLHPEAQDAFKLGEFNKVRVECIGNTIKTWLNGVPVVYFVDTLTANQGILALQVHAIGKDEPEGKKVYWKNIRIKTGDIVPTPFQKGIYVVNLKPNYITDYEKQNGWRLLFDGKTSSGWKGAYKKTFPDKGWVIRNGTITVLQSTGAESTNGGDIVTKEQFSAFDLSFQFKITPGANSGLKYFVTLTENNPGSAIGLEYQVLDDKVHPDAKMGRDGNRTLASLYDLIPANKSDRFVRGPGQWNTGRIIVYPDNKVEHYLNGVKVLEYVRGSQEYRDLVAESKYKVWQNFGEAEKGYILIQDHGNEVSYRSIKIRELH
jgi:3-keto-disaccharide hydrolase